MDLKYAWRSLSRTPGFSASSSSRWRWASARPRRCSASSGRCFCGRFLFPSQDRIVTLWESDARTRGAWQRVTPANFVDWKAQTSSFDALGAVPNWTREPWPFNVAVPRPFDFAQDRYRTRAGHLRLVGVLRGDGCAAARRPRVRCRRRPDAGQAPGRHQPRLLADALRGRSLGRRPDARGGHLPRRRLHHHRRDAPGIRLAARRQHLALARRLGRRADAAVPTRRSGAVPGTRRSAASSPASRSNARGPS